MNKSRIIVYAAILLCLLLCASFIKGCFKKTPPGPGFQQAPPAPAVAGLTKREITPRKVKALPKKEAAENLGLPADVAADPTEEIIDTADIPKAPYGATTATMLNTETGESHTLVNIKPPPIFEILTETSVGARYGITTKGNQAVDVYLKRDVLRVGNANLAVYGDVRINPKDLQTERRGMLDLSLRW